MRRFTSHWILQQRAPQKRSQSREIPQSAPKQLPGTCAGSYSSTMPSHPFAPSSHKRSGLVRVVIKTATSPPTIPPPSHPSPLSAITSVQRGRREEAARTFPSTQPTGGRGTAGATSSAPRQTTTAGRREAKEVPSCIRRNRCTEPALEVQPPSLWVRPRASLHSFLGGESGRRN